MRKYYRVRQPECFIAKLFNEAAIDLGVRRKRNIAMDRVIELNYVLKLSY